MSKKDRERAAATGEIHRDGKAVKMNSCPIKGCAHFVDPKSELGLCSECDRIGRVVKHGVIQTLLEFGILKRGPAPGKPQGPVKDKPQGPILLIPRPGMGRAAILKAAESAGVNLEQIEKGGRS